MLGRFAKPSAVAASADGTLVIVGEGTDARFVSTAWTSTDGETWQAVVLPPGGRILPRDVVAVADGFMSVGQTEGRDPRVYAWRSPDGLDWSDPVEIASGAEPRLAVAPEGEVMVALTRPDSDRPASVWRSRDGEGWQPLEIDTADAVPGGLVVSPDGTRVLAASSARFERREPPEVTLRLWRSADGDTWTDVAELPADLRGRYPDLFQRALLHAHGRFLLAVSPPPLERPGSIWASDDGEDWRLVADSPLPISMLAEGPCGPVAFTYPTTSSLTDIERLPDPLVLASTDGETWTPVVEDAFDGGVVRDTATAPDGRVVAIGTVGLGDPALWFGEPDTEQPAGPSSAPGATAGP